MSGSGNDFVVIDHRERRLAEDDIASFARAVCRRGLGLGADGVILIELPTRSDVDFRWRYLNADGSVGEMCGNGAMCGARFALRHGIAPMSCRFETEAGDIEAVVVDAANNPAVEIRIADAGLPVDAGALMVEGRTSTFARLLVGVPHVVTVVDDADAFADAGCFARWGRASGFTSRSPRPASTSTRFTGSTATRSGCGRTNAESRGRRWPAARERWHPPSSRWRTDWCRNRSRSWSAAARC